MKIIRPMCELFLLDGSRFRAILIADSVIMLANIVRSLDDRVEDV